ncbi:unnamed protein product [Fraxinus pennsylvanica]|uniref:Macro domain-containing protein n=1 Tax=Fraxinus pennsylvanica TaxID=56036 RepID=A0AAD2E2C4_9LAMI|nr:unnamed protein product [Fraxinus pennsylvanica]
MSTIIPHYSRFLRIFSARNSPNSLLNLRTQFRCTSNCYRTATVRALLRPFFFTGQCLANGRGRFSARFSGMSNAGGDGRQLLQFQLSPSNLLKIQKGDITLWSVDGSSDAIVNPANERMLGGGGADGAIHRAAGPELRAACYEVPEVRPGVRCPTGEARITPGFRLPASHVIHTVGPIYDEDENPKASLTNAYRNSLVVAKESNIQYVAFPAISCGVYGYPYDEAASVAISAVKEFANDLKEVHFVLFSDEIYDAWSRKANELLQNS